MGTNRRQYQYDEIRTSYTDGNTVRKLEAAPDIRRRERTAPVVDPRRRAPAPRRQEQRHPKELSGISMGSLLVLSVAIISTLYFCVVFLQLQSDVVKLEKDIISMESTLSAIKNENDAVSQQLNSSYDLEYVYQVAVSDLGMVYPNNNTMITYKSSDEGYVRQYQDIPK